MRRALLLAVSFFLLAGAAVNLPAAAQARTWTAPCLPGGGGPTCHWWDAKVVSINDGDTIGVKVNGRGRVYQVRFIGVQAMELHRYGNYRRWAGECHAVPAARRVLQLMRATHWHVVKSSEVV